MMHADQLLKRAVDRMIRSSQEFTTNSWQGQRDTEFKMREILFYEGHCFIPNTLDVARDMVKPDLPWADKHFEERVSRLPSNPGESYKIWPYFTPGSEDKVFNKFNGKFFSTYQERFWPKFAGNKISDNAGLLPEPMNGIRFEYGDLDDVINLMYNDPSTRQAYLPLFFPEDTGVVHGDRAMCSLGYDFIIRNGFLHTSYYMRSADLMRHFKNDVYLAIRLNHWVIDELKVRAKKDKLTGDRLLLINNLKPGTLNLYVKNLHIFESDFYTLKKRGIWKTGE